MSLRLTEVEKYTLFDYQQFKWIVSDKYIYIYIYIYNWLLCFVLISLRPTTSCPYVAPFLLSVQSQSDPSSLWGIRDTALIARFMRPTWGPSGANRTQVGPMMALWIFLWRTATIFTNILSQWWVYGPDCSNNNNDNMQWQHLTSMEQGQSFYPYCLHFSEIWKQCLTREKYCLSLIIYFVISSWVLASIILDTFHGALSPGVQYNGHSLIIIISILLIFK